MYERGGAHQTHDSASPAIPPAIKCVVKGTFGLGPVVEDDDVDADDEADEDVEEKSSLVLSTGGSRKVGLGAVYRSPVRPPPKGFEVDVDISAEVGVGLGWVRGWRFR